MKPEEITKETPIYTISVVSELLNISTHTLRMYEREGLIIPYKKHSNHRLYSQNDLEKLTYIRNAIKDKKISISAMKMMYSLIPCWKIINCPEEDRNNCKAYNYFDTPCWTMVHYNNVCSNRNCRECEVYKEQTNCKRIKEIIKEFTK